jgi:NDP-sugar pyrophosphorylase family protein
MLTLFILAGGLGTRIQTVNPNLPKYLMPVNNEPFALHQLRWLKKAGFEKIVLCVNHRAESIVTLIGNGHHLGLAIEYAFDGEKLLGTGGAIRKASQAMTAPFGVLYGDSYLTMDFKAVYQHFLTVKKSGLLTIFRNENSYEKSNLCVIDNRIVAYDKKNLRADMQYIDYGFSVFSPEVFSNFGDSPFDLSDVIQYLIQENELSAYEVHDRYYEIGTPAGLQSLETYLRNNWHATES